MENSCNILCQNETISEPSKTFAKQDENAKSDFTIDTLKQNEKEHLTPTIKIGRVYLITNLINSKKYVGVTTKTLKHRWQQHCWSSTRNKQCRLIGKAIKKYAKENFKMELIEEMLDVSEKDLLTREAFYIAKYNTFADGGHGYNLIRCSEGHFIYSEKTRQKISENQRGEKNQFYGKRHSEKSLALMSQSHMGSKAHLGKPHTEETRKRLSDLLSGEKSPRYNPLVMRFHNIFSGEEFIGPQFYFRKKYNLKNPTLSKLINGKTKSYRGWVVVCEA